MELALAEQLCKRLMLEHGVSHFGFAWMNGRRTFGYCQFGRLGRQYRHANGAALGGTIMLSRPLVSLNDETHVRDTILHEIAHALVGPHHGHGRVWKAMAARVGARPERCYHDSVARPPHNWELVCKVHGVVGRRVRRGRSLQACTQCCRARNGGRFHADYLLEWRMAGHAIEPVTIALEPVSAQRFPLTPIQKAWITRRAKIAAQKDA